MKIIKVPCLLSFISFQIIIRRNVKFRFISLKLKEKDKKLILSEYELKSKLTVVKSKLVVNLNL